MSYLRKTYEVSFLLTLICLGVFALKWGPVMAAQRIGPRAYTTTEARRVPVKPGRRFSFEPGGKIGLAPRALKGSERYDYYAALCGHFGREPVRTTVLGLRGLAPDGQRHPSGDNMSDYDDTFVVLRPWVRDSREFLGSTHAGQAVSSRSPQGVAQIHPGVYQADPVGDFNGMPAWWVTRGWGDGTLPCFRDKNGDGFVEGVEREKTRWATEILFHNGRNEEYGTSIGCQVLSPKAMRNFIATIGEGESFDYVLVDANRALASPAWQTRSTY